jgi:hypothetical protein
LSDEEVNARQRQLCLDGIVEEVFNLDIRTVQDQKLDPLGLSMLDLLRSATCTPQHTHTQIQRKRESTASSSASPPFALMSAPAAVLREKGERIVSVVPYATSSAPKRQ